MRVDWVDGEPMEVTATWSAPDPDDAPNRPLDRSDFLREPEASAPARDEDDNRPKPRQALS